MDVTVKTMLGKELWLPEYKDDELRSAVKKLITHASKDKQMGRVDKIVIDVL